MNEISNILNTSNCVDVLRKLKPFKEFIHSDDIFLRNRVKIRNGKFCIYNQRKANETCAISEYLEKELKNAVDYSRKFMILAALHHLEHMNFDLASSYINQFSHYTDGQYILSMIMRKYELLIDNTTPNFISKSAEIAKMIDNTKDSFSDMINIFFEACFNARNVEMFVVLHHEIEKIHDFKLNELSKEELIERCVPEKQLTSGKTKYIAHVGFIVKLFEIYGFNMMNSSLFHTEEKLISNTLFEIITNSQGRRISNTFKTMMLKIVLKIPGIVQFYRSNPCSEFTERLWRLIFSKLIYIDRCRFMCCKMLLKSGIINVNCELQLTKRDVNSNYICYQTCKNQLDVYEYDDY